MVVVVGVAGTLGIDCQPMTADSAISEIPANTAALAPLRSFMADPIAPIRAANAFASVVDITSPSAQLSWPQSFLRKEKHSDAEYGCTYHSNPECEGVSELEPLALTGLDHLKVTNKSAQVVDQ